MDNTTQSQYAVFKGARPNARNFKPFSPESGQGFETWAALNDVNILSMTEDTVVCEFAFIVDGRKKWAKQAWHFAKGYYASYSSVQEVVASLVSAVRDEIDETRR